MFYLLHRELIFQIASELDHKSLMGFNITCKSMHNITAQHRLNYFIYHFFNSLKKLNLDLDLNSYKNKINHFITYLSRFTLQNGKAFIYAELSQHTDRFYQLVLLSENGELKHRYITLCSYIKYNFGLIGFITPDFLYLLSTIDHEHLLTRHSLWIRENSIDCFTILYGMETAVHQQHDEFLQLINTLKPSLTLSKDPQDIYLNHLPIENWIEKISNLSKITEDELNTHKQIAKANVHQLLELDSMEKKDYCRLF